MILLAEDHPVNRTVIVQQLDVVGFHVDVAEDGQEAFERFVSGRYGLVLTDLNMPRMDGYELAQAIRRHERRSGRGPHARARAQRERHAGRAGARAGGRHGRLHGQADDDSVPGREAPPVAARPRVGPRGTSHRRTRPARPPSTWERSTCSPLGRLRGAHRARRLPRHDARRSRDAARGARPATRARCAACGARIRGRRAHRRSRPMARIAQQAEEATETELAPDWTALEALAARLSDAADAVAEGARRRQRVASTRTPRACGAFRGATGAQRMGVTHRASDRCATRIWVAGDA